MFSVTKTHEITVDVVILTIKNDNIQVLLVKRTTEPFKGNGQSPEVISDCPKTWMKQL